jgi:hypothetical protein
LLTWLAGAWESREICDDEWLDDIRAASILLFIGQCNARPGERMDESDRRASLHHVLLIGRSIYRSLFLFLSERIYSIYYIKL